MSLVTSLDSLSTTFIGHFWVNYFGGRRILNTGQAVGKYQFISALCLIVIAHWASDKLVAKSGACFDRDNPAPFIKRALPIYLGTYGAALFLLSWLLPSKMTVAIGLLAVSIATHCIFQGAIYFVTDKSYERFQTACFALQEGDLSDPPLVSYPSGLTEEDLNALCQQSNGLRGSYE